MANRSELRTQIFRALNEDPTTPVFWSAAEMNGVIDEAIETLVEEAPAIKRRFTIPRRAGAFVYQLAGVGENIMTPYRIWLPDLKRRLEPWSITDLDARHETWMDVTGDPWVWAPVDWRKFIIWPIPATPGGTMEIDCYAWPEDLGRDVDIPELHPSSHESIVTYGRMEGYLKQWDGVRAVDALVEFSSNWVDAQARAGTKQMQSAFNVRAKNTGINGGDT